MRIATANLFNSNKSIARVGAFCKICFTFSKINFTFVIWLFKTMNKHLLSTRWLIPSGIVFYTSTFIGILLMTSTITLDTVIIEVSIPNLFKLDDPLVGHQQAWIKNNWMDEILGFLLSFSGLIHGFSAESDEDEYANFLRFQALKWSLIINYSLLTLVSLFVYGFAYWQVILISMYSVLVTFIVWFRISIIRHRR